MNMATSNTIDYLNKKNNIKKLQQMQEAIKYQRIVIEEREHSLSWFLRLLGRMDESGDSIIKADESANSTHDGTMEHGFHFGTLAIAGLDFIRIPLIYLIAYLLNKEVPITLNNNARWLYSGILLGLTIAAFAAPPIAPIIAFVSAGVGFCASAFFLGKTLYQRYKLGRERKKILSELAHEEREMLRIQQEAAELELQLEQVQDEQHVIAIYQKMAGVIECYEQQKIKIQELKNKSLTVEEQLKEVGTLRVIDKSIGLIVASLAVIGLVVSLFFPPAGLGIIAGAAAAGAVYFVARLVVPLFISLGHWIANQFKSAPVTEQEVVPEAPELNDELSKQASHESTADVMCGLMAKREAIQTLQVAHDPAVWDEDPVSTKAPTPPLEAQILIEPADAVETDDDEERERQGEHL